jgi:RNase P subunit RPR2
MDTMVKTVNRSLVKAVAGRLIFCPGCKRVLDAPTTVVVTAKTDDSTTGRCAECFDVFKARLTDQAGGEATLATLDVVDGRDLFATRKRGPSKPRRTRCRGCGTLHPRGMMFRSRNKQGVWCEPCYLGDPYTKAGKRR